MDYMKFMGVVLKNSNIEFHSRGNDRQQLQNGAELLRKVGLRLFALGLFSSLPFAQSAQAQYFNLGKGSPLEFYDTDYSYLANPANRADPLDALHYIPLLALGPDAYLSLGGELREQGWNQNNKSYTLNGKTRFNSYDLQRELFNFYLHFNSHLGIFAQPARYDSFGEVSPKTTDQVYGRLQQGFVQLMEPVGPA